MLHISPSKVGDDLPAGAHFHEAIAAGWTGSYQRGSFRARLACFASILDRHVRRGEAWVDLGCGSGVLTRELLRRGATVVAVDGSPSMLREARGYVGKEAGTPPTWVQSDVQAIPQLATESFDGVLCSSVVEYLERPRALLEEAARVLRPGGILILSAPPRGSALRMAQKAARKLAGSFGVNRFSYLSVSRTELDPHELGSWLGRAGFALERVAWFDPLLPTWALSVLRPSLMIMEARRSDRTGSFS
jgi:ubiquinone/menaquinone biosynthesis C-methylase UbiE